MAPRFVIVFLLMSACVSAQPLPLPAISGVFTPSLRDSGDPLLSADLVITSANVDEYIPWLDETVVDSLRTGQFTITLGPLLDFPTHPRYLKVTQDNLDSATISQTQGELSNYRGGRPFSTLDVSDPQAGIKTAWNMRYAYAPDETETARFIWRYRDMRKEKLERTLTMYGAILRYTYRHSHEPFPALEGNPSKLFSALYLRVDSPQDIRNTQLLIHRAQLDTEPEQAWIYLNTQRRVKRIGTGQKTDAFLGSDIMIEDFLGYNGRIVDMEWTYLGSEELLLPMYGNTQLSLSRQELDERGYGDIEFTGKGSCFPDVTWQLRKVHRLEAVPKDPRHPLSRRHYVIDAATFTPMLTRIYDRSGKLWKLGISAASHSGLHSLNNEAWQGAITDGVSMIDLQAEHCTTLNLKSQLASKRLRQKSFTTSYLRQMGR